MRGNKNLVAGVCCRRTFSSAGMNKILAHEGTPICYWGNGGVPLIGKTLIFKFTLI